MPKQRSGTREREIVKAREAILAILIFAAAMLPIAVYNEYAQGELRRIDADIEQLRKEITNSMSWSMATYTAEHIATVNEMAESPLPNPWTEEEIEAIARTLSGECYEDKPEDKRLVAEVILNRVSDGRFGDDVITVVTAPKQFDGYWQTSRNISHNDREIATQTLSDWYDGDCRRLSEYLFFEAGANRENVFREEY